MLNGQDSRWEPVVAEQLLAQNKINERHPLHLNVLYDETPLHVNIAQRLVGQLNAIRYVACGCTTSQLANITG